MTQSSSEVLRQIAKRRTFAIISHPDAGKTTLTEKLLLFGNAIQMAGMVKAKKDKRFATSDWMEIEKQRGISVASSVMQFVYKNININLLDTPGHQDFSEDTYRVLTAVDSALMVIDGAKGIETQTRKLFKVCRDRHLPIMTFINKMDRETKDPFDLLAEIETELNLKCAPMTWPIGTGHKFAGVYDLENQFLRLFVSDEKNKSAEQKIIPDLNSPELKIDADLIKKCHEDLELVQGAGHRFDKQAYLRGELCPVFFGSGINNFGIQELLDLFIVMAPAPLERAARTRMVSPAEKTFTGMVFKIQANMDSRHRDRCAFIRLCSGEFTPGMSVYHTRLKRHFKLNTAVQFMSQERKVVENAFAGDIIGMIDRGNLCIGDTLTEGEDLQFTGIPQFAPDLFAKVELKNPIRSKQLLKGLEQLAEEGSSQLFRRKYNSDNIIGVVGHLQFEVVKFRLLAEYGAEAEFIFLDYACSRWYKSNDLVELKNFEEYYLDRIVFDARGYAVMLFKDDWEQNYVQNKFKSFAFYDNLITFEAEIS